MNYFFWFLPLTLIVGLFCWYFGHIFFRLLPKKIQNHPFWYWLTLMISVGVSVYLRTPVLGFLLYFTLFHFIYDGLRILTYPFKKVNNFLRKINIKELPLIIFAFVFTLYGLFNAMHPEKKEYTISLNKEVKKEIKIAFLSDLHLGTPYLDSDFKDLITTINNDNYDVFVLGGDIFDEWTTDSQKEKFFEVLKQIKTQNGLYYIEGNHDVLNEEVTQKYRKSGVRVLQDEVVLIENRYYLIGRKDRMTGKVQNLKNLLKNVDSTLPLIVLEHQPSNVSELEENKIDLSISGHTHGGQIWPANYFVMYGYYDNGYSKSIVSSGYGEWGMPIKTAYHSELVSITLKEKEYPS